MCVRACVRACLSVCLSVCMSVCLSVVFGIVAAVAVVAEFVLEVIGISSSSFSSCQFFYFQTHWETLYLSAQDQAPRHYPRPAHSDAQPPCRPWSVSYTHLTLPTIPRV